MKDSHNEDLSAYPQKVINLINDKKYFGRMNDPSGASYLKGPCGDDMEFYLAIEQGRITQIKYYTEGCFAARACAAMAAKLAESRTLKDALAISAADVVLGLEGLPQDHLHCSILSVSTLYRAIADYLLKA